MQTKVQKWGNSLGLRIPKSFAEQAGVEAGSEVDLSVEDAFKLVMSAGLVAPEDEATGPGLAPAAPIDPS